MRVADYIANFIYENGTKHVFLLSGGGIMHLTDGLACNKKLKKICVHHEQAASMAIESYSRLTGKMGVGFFTTGPGSTNAITGLAGAWIDSTPCLFISGQAKRRDSIYMAKIKGIRQIGVQELNIIPVIIPLTKYSAFIDNPNDIRFHLEKAYFMAKEGRPGPVWLDIPLDVQGAIINPKKLKKFNPPKNKTIIPEKEIQKISSYLKSAKRPVILAGQGVRISGATENLLTIAKNYKIPIVTTYLGIDIISEDHPCYIGRIGIKGTRAGNLAMQNADLLIIIGSSLPVSEVNFEYNQFAREAKIIVVDTDLSSHKKKTIKIDSLIQADAKYFIKKLSFLIKSAPTEFDSIWLGICSMWKNKYPVCLPEYKNLKDKINLYHFIDEISKQLKNNDVVITDAGSVFYAGAQGIKIKNGVRYITSGGLATMGYGLPASIGTSVATNERTICITGDGSFQQNIQELQTLTHYNLPVKIFLINNNGYLSIRFTQTKFFDKRFIGTDVESGVSFPNAEKIAKAYGIKFIRTKDSKKLSHIINFVLNYEGPIICEVVTPENQEIIPTVASEKKENGKMVSKPLEDMYPFLDREEFKKNMFIKPLK